MTTGAPLTAAAPVVAEHARELLGPLVDVSSPFGDARGAEACLAIASAAVPSAEVQRLPSSTPGLADDLLLRVPGTGRARILLLGHVDTVVGHNAHAPLTDDGETLHGSGSIDMKGGDALALAILARFAAEPELRERVGCLDLLLVCDEEWRTGPMLHGPRFAGHDACLCFEAGQRATDGAEEVIVRRKAAASVVIEARGRAAHAGAAPDDGRSALLALAEIAGRLAELHDPHGPDRRTVVPSILTSGEAVNVVPAHGTLSVDVRADDLAAVDAVLGAVPAELGGVRLTAGLGRSWPGMDATSAAAPVLGRAGTLLGRPVRAAGRGGASDASHVAQVVPVTIDGLGPLGGGAHAPGEHVLAPSLLPRAEVALAVLDAALELPRTAAESPRAT